MKRVHKKSRLPLIIIIFVIIVAVFASVLLIKDKKERNSIIDYGTIGQVEVPDIEEIDKEKEEGKENIDMDIYVWDVGQALSVLVDFGQFEVLYDGGYAKDGEKISKKIRPYIDGNLEYVIASHPHADHVGGLARIYEDYQVDNTVYGGGTNIESAEVEKFLEAAKNEKNSRFMEDSDMVIDMGNDAQMTIIETLDEGDTENPNDLSVISYIEYGNCTMLIEGDAEAEAEKVLKNRFENLTFMVAGHHGSNSSNSCISIWRPDVFVISCAKVNDYGHPDKEVLAEAELIGSSVYGTYRNGDVIFTTSGDDYIVKCRKGDSLY